MKRVIRGDIIAAMSPTAHELETAMGRELVKGDILVRTERTSTSVMTQTYSYFEVTGPKIDNLHYGFLGRFVGDGVAVRRMSPHGPHRTESVISKDEDHWVDMVPKEERTDLQR